jgi:transcriptional regulator with XRE-family HTH domain
MENEQGRLEAKERVGELLLGERIRLARLRIGISISELSRRSGVSISNLGKAEKTTKEDVFPLGAKALRKIEPVLEAHLECYASAFPRQRHYRNLLEGRENLTLGKRIRLERAQLGWNAETLAKKSGFSVCSILIWEREERPPPLRYLEILEETLGVRLVHLWKLGKVNRDLLKSLEKIPRPNFGKRLAIARLRNNKTIGLLAQEIGVDEHTITGWEKKGRKPRQWHKFLKLQGALTMSLGSRMALIRLWKGLSQREMAEFLEVCRRTYIYWERDHRFPWKEAQERIFGHWPWLVPLLSRSQKRNLKTKRGGHALKIPQEKEP